VLQPICCRAASSVYKECTNKMAGAHLSRTGGGMPRAARPACRKEPFRSRHTSQPATHHEGKEPRFSGLIRSRHITCCLPTHPLWCIYNHPSVDTAGRPCSLFFKTHRLTGSPPAIGRMLCRLLYHVWRTISCASKPSQYLQFHPHITS
jgi:hypothetical protein